MRHVFANSSVILSGTKWSRRIFIGILFAALCFFVACDSGSSSADPDPVAEISSSSGDDDNISSSSVSDKGKSSGGSSKSSSSVKSGDDSQKSSSSVSGKNSSSSVVKLSSSSVILFKQCEEGDTVITEAPAKRYYYRCSENGWVVDSVVDIIKPKFYPNMDSVFNLQII